MSHLRRGAGAAFVLAALFLSGASPSHADPYEKAAHEISRIAGRQAKRRIAVLPFLPVSGGESQGSLALAERLTAKLSQQEGIEIMERTLLEKVLHEQGLGYQGLIDPRQSNQVGRVLGVDSILTGTYLTLAEGKLEVNARLIDAETARILGVSTMQVPQDWQGSALSGSFDVIVPPPDIGDGAPVMGLSGTYRDAVASGESCSGWEIRVDEMQSTILELKARYWASRLQEKGFSARSLTRNPGSEIRSLTLRQDFFRRVRDLYEAGWRGSISTEESALLETSDRAVGALMENCYR
ncbi:MAG: hypothetical protein HY922_11115 [Elusimicrobia bacterium]|nr:hypothetical protein [Elusimicrobiota bacterium]